ncbi:MAG TPA: polyprenyl synthetase family protein [Saprospiraceae bacterium]|nr:polyprenyl synthetase family protein [Saprospiraceae bacterium]
MVVSFNSIQKPIQEELKVFEGKFKDAMRSHIPLLNKITYYIVKRKGKQVRPMFVFLSARMLSTPTETTFHAASLVELLHTATLVHDDVVDDSFERRGFFSINALWKNKIAVLVGDYLLSRGLLLALENNEYALLQILSKAVKQMSEGELLQIEKARSLDIKEEVYYDVIRQKTASLIAAACSAGAASSTKDEAVVEKFRLFGEYIGMAFQIKDDLFDFGDVDVGKPLGIDIKEKKMTLPLIYALQNAPRDVKQKIIYIIKNQNQDKHKVSEVIQFVQKSGGIEYSKEVMLRYRSKALEILSEFEDSESKSAMYDLVMYVTDREK